MEASWLVGWRSEREEKRRRVLERGPLGLVLEEQVVDRPEVIGFGGAHRELGGHSRVGMEIGDREVHEDRRNTQCKRNRRKEVPEDKRSLGCLVRPG